MKVRDVVQMPELGAFHDAPAYYATLFHELGHSTGHRSRLDRGLGQSHSFGDAVYSREELVAEMTSAFLCGETQIDSVPLLENAAAYLDSWRRVLKADTRAVVLAAAQAQKAADMILNRPAKGPAAE